MTDLENVLNAVLEHLRKFVVFSDENDPIALSLFCAHTHALEHTRTTPRVIIDSSTYGSGKTTLLEHIAKLSHKPLLATSISPALLPRVLDTEVRTVLVDEAEKSLRPDKEGVSDIFSVINNGYRKGVTRPTLISQGNDWVVRESEIFAPVVMAGNAPTLPDDTRSRCIRVLLMPDLHGEAEETDWDDIENETIALRENLAACIDQAAEQITVKPQMPDGCRGRMKDKWMPLARIAHAAGGHWPERIETAIAADMEELKMEREDGLASERPSVRLLQDIGEVWSEDESFVPTAVLIDRLKAHNPRMWGPKPEKPNGLTPQGMGRMLVTAFKIHSSQPVRTRGYVISSYERAWRQFGVPHPHLNRDNRVKGETVRPLDHGSTALTESTVRTEGSCQHGFDASNCQRCLAEQAGAA